jgi:hypothetical protein
MSNITPTPTATFTYAVPDKLRRKVLNMEVTSITVGELSAMDELRCAQAARGDATVLAFQLAMASLRAINDKPVSPANGTQEQAWSEMGPKLRNLVMAAYSEINNADREVSEDFLKSRRVTVA